MPITNLYNNESPLFHSSSAEHLNTRLFLDFNKQDVLQGLYYTIPKGSKWGLQLSELAKECEKKSFFELQRGVETSNTNCDSFFDLPSFLLKEALEIYRGKVPALNELKKCVDDELICRCFGIYKNELLDVLDSNPEFKEKDLTNATRAGAGCSTCLGDFQELFSEARVRQAKKLLDS
ncbi:MAG: hypothetical protein CME70_01900 [Halobacteriovorax sp.]|nr:hypothetical protein [Halobacteriovorax sp.]|tara:strand:+ start:40363 stop:40896 length:534 start_codon:yes stop_codon:yes gene_type:complete